MKRMRRHGWNLQTMNEYCINEKNGYTVLGIEWIQKPYQRQLHALVKCPNLNHEPYKLWWNNFINGYFCKQCDYENNNKLIWNKELVTDFYKKNGLTVINVDDWHTVDKPIAVEDDEGFKYMASITTIKQSGNKSSYKFNPFNLFSLENIKLYCRLYRPDYEILSEKYTGIKSEYIWKYNGDLLPKTEDKEFIHTADGFINGGCGHPYFWRSNGNKIFQSELIKHNIRYKAEKTFKGCKDKKLLRFDFYLYKTNEVIEIDGEQHKKIVGLFGGEEGYNDRMRKDNIKNDYCKKNGIKITRIPYETNKIEIYRNLVDEKINEILSN